MKTTPPGVMQRLGELVNTMEEAFRKLGAKMDDKVNDISEGEDDELDRTLMRDQSQVKKKSVQPFMQDWLVEDMGQENKKRRSLPETNSLNEKQPPLLIPRSQAVQKSVINFEPRCSSTQVQTESSKSPEIRNCHNSC